MDAIREMMFVKVWGLFNPFQSFSIHSKASGGAPPALEASHPGEGSTEKENGSHRKEVKRIEKESKRRVLLPVQRQDAAPKALPEPRKAMRLSRSLFGRSL